MKINYSPVVKNNFQRNSIQKNSPVLASIQSNTMSFGVSNSYHRTSKALFLALMALVSEGSIDSAKFIRSQFCETGNKIEFDSLKKHFNRYSKLLAEEISPKSLINLSGIKIYQETEIPDILEKLSKDTVSINSYYRAYRNTQDNSMKAIFARKLTDYKKLFDDVPEKITKKGAQEILKYKSGIISILENCSEYGAMYIKNIPDKENMFLHAQGINRLVKAAEQIQGCKLKNCTLVNGLSYDELLNKVVIPNEKIAKGEPIGKNQNTLIMIMHESGTDTNNAFRYNFESDFFTKKTVDTEVGIVNFDEPFIKYYHNIIMLQPNGIEADPCLNNGLGKIEASLVNGANTDIGFMAHSEPGRTMLSVSGRQDSSSLDAVDFSGLDKGRGKPFAQSIKRIFENSIKQGYKPRIIAIGCNTDKTWKHIGDMILGENQDKIQVLGTPFDTTNAAKLGFTNGELKLYVKEYRE